MGAQHDLSRLAWPNDGRERAEIRGRRQRRGDSPAIEKRRIPGFLSIDLMRRILPDGGSEFATLMWFTDLDSIRAFTGEDYAKSHVPSNARAVLSSFDERADHYEVIDRRAQA